MGLTDQFDLEGTDRRAAAQRNLVQINLAQ